VSGPAAEVRRLTERDAQSLWNLRLSALETDPDAFAESAGRHRATPVAVYAERLRSGGSENFVFGAFEGSELVAMAGLYPEQTETRRQGRIWGVFVKPRCRGRGFGRAVLGALLAHVKDRTAFHAVALEVAETQEPARRLYLSLGFQPIGRGARGGEEMLLLLF
jgi:ribosomal protein S18 acetylase RimI-like enzyme